MATFSQTSGSGCLAGLPLRWGETGSLSAATPTDITFAETLNEGPAIIMPYYVNSEDVPDDAALVMAATAAGFTGALVTNGDGGSGPLGYISLGDQSSLAVPGSFNFGSIIFQWGNSSNSSGFSAGTTYSIPFANAFPNACWWAGVVPIVPGANSSLTEGYAWPYALSFTPSEITLMPTASQDGSTEFTEVGYLAIGH